MEYHQQNISSRRINLVFILIRDLNKESLINLVQTLIFTYLIAAMKNQLCLLVKFAATS